MISQSPFFALLGLFVFREFFHAWQINKLLNKAMSRSYFEHEQARHLAKPMPALIREETDEPEDLGALHGIG